MITRRPPIRRAGAPAGRARPFRRVALMLRRPRHQPVPGSPLTIRAGDQISVTLAPRFTVVIAQAARVAAAVGERAAPFAPFLPPGAPASHVTAPATIAPRRPWVLRSGPRSAPGQEPVVAAPDLYRPRPAPTAAPSRRPTGPSRTIALVGPGRVAAPAAPARRRHGGERFVHRGPAARDARPAFPATSRRTSDVAGGIAAPRRRARGRLVPGPMTPVVWRASSVEEAVARRRSGDLVLASAAGPAPRASAPTPPAPVATVYRRDRRADVPTPAAPPVPVPIAPAPGPAVDIDQLDRELWRRFEKRVRTERERRGRA